ncbi:MAG TPA: DUF2264 domain-containing protein, partial [Rectinemataceae bacterium]
MPGESHQLRKNPLRTRDDLLASLDSLIEPVLGCFVDGNSGLDLGAFAAHYDQRATRLEGFSRLLWGLGPMIAQAATEPEAAPGADGPALKAARLAVEGLA